MKIQNSKSFLPPLVCLFVVLAWFSPWWIGGKNLAPLDLQSLMMSPWREGNETHFAKNHIVSDAVDQYLVYRMVAAESYAKEGWLGWSSLTYGGTAQYANTMALYYDWTMQLHRWFGFWTAWHLGLMGQVMLAVIGMYLFLRGRSISGLWAACGGLAYAANSQFVTWIYHRWALSSFCWVPWILWAIDGYRRGNRNYWAAVPVFIGMAFLGGTLQHAAIVALAVAAMWLEESILQYSKSKPASQLRRLGHYAVWGLLGAGLAGMMFIPCTDAFLTSNRLGLHTGMNANAEKGIYPHGWLQPLFNLAAYPFQVFPSLLGRCNSIDLLKIFKSELFYIAYFGSLPVLIAFLAPWRKESPLLARLLIVFGLLLPLTPLVRTLYQRLFMLFILGGILAFAHFMENANRQRRLAVFRVTGWLVALGVTAWTSLSLLLYFKSDLLTQLRAKIIIEGKGSSFGYFGEWISQRTDHFLADLFIWSPQQLLPLLLFGASLAGLRWTASENTRWRNKGAWIVALAIIGEVTLFGSRWIVWSDPHQYALFPATPESEVLKSKVGHEGRVTTLMHPNAHMARTPFIPNTLSAYGIAADNGYDSIIPNGMLLPGEFSGDADKLGRLGVSHLITWPSNPKVSLDWKPVWKSSSMVLYENAKKMPRYAGFRTNEDKNAFFTGKWPSTLVVREISDKENSRLLEVPAGVRWIRLAENQADGWKFRIAPSHTWLSVDRASDSSMLIENTTFDHATSIEMRYDPPLRTIGFCVSAISLGLLIILGSREIVRASSQSQINIF
ncbi:MAG: hypothetical protein JHD23_09280 [Akkermansiaceae bacterium]|nr:hypothetical protein [Akkermansiaceae bacterium]